MRRQNDPMDYLPTDDVARIRELRYPNRTDRTELMIFVQWTDKFVSVLDPWPYPGTIEVVRAESDGRSLLPPAALLIGTAAVGAADGKSMFRTNHYQSRADHRLPDVRGRWRVDASSSDHCAHCGGWTSTLESAGPFTIRGMRPGTISPHERRWGAPAVQLPHLRRRSSYLADILIGVGSCSQASRPSKSRSSSSTYALREC